MLASRALANGVSVLRRLRDGREAMPVVGERRVQLREVAVGTVGGCLRDLASPACSTAQAQEELVSWVVAVLGYV